MAGSQPIKVWSKGLRMNPLPGTGLVGVGGFRRASFVTFKRLELKLFFGLLPGLALCGPSSVDALHRREGSWLSCILIMHHIFGMHLLLDALNP